MNNYTILRGAIKTKGRRKIAIADRDFVYYSDTWNLRIASVDKKFIVRLNILFIPWDIQQPSGFTPLEIIGSEFPKQVKLHKNKSDCQQQHNIWVKYPQEIGQGRELTPKVVRRIIEWCFDIETQAEQLSLSDFETIKSS